jgi:hypothetical protein
VAIFSCLERENGALSGCFYVGVVSTQKELRPPRAFSRVVGRGAWMRGDLIGKAALSGTRPACFGGGIKITNYTKICMGGERHNNKKWGAWT